MLKENIYTDEFIPNIDYNVSDFEVIGNKLEIDINLNNPGFLIVAILRLGDSRKGEIVTV